MCRKQGVWTAREQEVASRLAGAPQQALQGRGWQQKQALAQQPVPPWPVRGWGLGQHRRQRQAVALHSDGYLLPVWPVPALPAEPPGTHRLFQFCWGFRWHSSVRCRGNFDRHPGRCESAYRPFERCSSPVCRRFPRQPARGAPPFQQTPFRVRHPHWVPKPTQKRPPRWLPVRQLWVWACSSPPPVRGAGDPSRRQPKSLPAPPPSTLRFSDAPCTSLSSRAGF